MSTVDSRWGADVNAEQTAAWDGPLFDRFVQFREVVTTGLGAHGEEALRLVPPQPGHSKPVSSFITHVGRLSASLAVGSISSV